MNSSDQEFLGSWYLWQSLWTLTILMANPKASDRQLLKVFVPGLSLASGACSAHAQSRPEHRGIKPTTLATALNAWRINTPGCSPLGCDHSEQSTLSPSAPSAAQGVNPLDSTPSTGFFPFPPFLPRSTSSSTSTLHCPVPLGIRSQIYVALKAQILLQPQADDLPSGADSEARHGEACLWDTLASEPIVCPQVRHSWHSVPVFSTQTPPRCLAVYPKSRRVFVL